MSDKNKKPKGQVTLKRKVSVFAIVTDKFKEYLKIELEENVKNAKRRLQEIEAQKQAVNGNEAAASQLAMEQNQIQQMLEQAPAQEKSIEDLEDGTSFSQGTIDGFVSVNVGDNLYEKLGGMEMIVKDGVIEKITAMPSMSLNQNG